MRAFFLQAKAVHRDGFCYTVQMTWANERRLIILGIISLVVLSIFGGTYYLFAHKAPSCTDGKLNQDETGIDCGGSCTYVCSDTQAPLSVRFVRALSILPGRTDVVAYIDNPNPKSALRKAPYIIDLYNDQNLVIAKKSLEVDIPAGGTVPIFIPNIYSGDEIVARGFLTFDEEALHWFTSDQTHSQVIVKDILFSQQEPPRITATIENPTAGVLRNVKLIVTVFDASGNAIGASQTIAPRVPAQNSTQVVFTWPSAFSSPVSRIDIVPLVSLSP